MYVNLRDIRDIKDTRDIRDIEDATPRFEEDRTRRGNETGNLDSSWLLSP